MCSIIDDTLLRVFGPNAIEYNRHYVGFLDDTALSMLRDARSIHEIRLKIRSAVPEILATVIRSAVK